MLTTVNVAFELMMLVIELVTVELPAVKPPNKYSWFVVLAPLLVTACKLPVAAAAPGQFVPFERHTLKPFTAIAAAFKVVPEAVVKPNHPELVPFTNETLVKDVFPSTVNVLVTVELAAIKPLSKYNWFVVVAPLLEIC